MQANKKQTNLLIAAIALLTSVLAVLALALALTPNETLTSHSAQAEAEAKAKALKEAEKDGYYDTDPIEVVKLTELMGCTTQEALELIGRGAEINGEAKLVAGGLTEVTVLLGEEAATIDTGMSYVQLYLNREKQVVQASYSININELSGAKLPFDKIVNEAKLVDRVLAGAGLTTFEPNPITAPSRENCAVYDSSGKTTVEERYQFVGTGANAEGATFNWSVYLKFDYAQAIKTNNLANTVRSVSVSINSLNS